MGSKNSRAETIGAAILGTAAVTAAVTTLAFSLGATPSAPVVTQRSVVYVPFAAPVGASAENANGVVGRTSLTSGELAGASASDTAESPGSEPSSADDTPAPSAGPGYALSDVLEGACARLEAIGAAALSSTPAPVETPVVLAEAASAPAQEAPQEVASAPEPVAQKEAPPAIGAGSFTTPPLYGASSWQSPTNAGAGAFTTPGPFSASAWQSNPSAGAGQFSTDKGSIDPGAGAGPFTTEWHVPTSYPY